MVRPWPVPWERPWGGEHLGLIVKVGEGLRAEGREDPEEGRKQIRRGSASWGQGDGGRTGSWSEQCVKRDRRVCPLDGQCWEPACLLPRAASAAAPGAGGSSDGWRDSAFVPPQSQTWRVLLRVW